MFASIGTGPHRAEPCQAAAYPALPRISGLGFWGLGFWGFRVLGFEGFRVLGF